MLSREVCEELARAVPEVREHDTLHEGDLLYLRDGSLRAVSREFIPLGRSKDGWPVWCPSLSDLLGIATKRSALPVCLLGEAQGWLFGP